MDRQSTGAQPDISEVPKASQDANQKLSKKKSKKEVARAGEREKPSKPSQLKTTSIEHSNLSMMKIGTLLESHKHLKQLTAKNSKQINSAVLKDQLLKSVKNLNRTSDENLHKNSNHSFHEYQQQYSQKNQSFLNKTG